MNRIGKAYEGKFRTLLARAGARRLEQGVQRLFEKARRLSASGNVSMADALTCVYEEFVSKPYFREHNSRPAPSRFFCDAGLGGLARWLRAAGYEALWEAGIDDKVLLHEARKADATLLTTDSMLMEHGILREAVIPALWLPPTLKIPEQLALVFREFGLAAREPRCASCGGELRRGEKEALREQIPPRTYLWLNEYFVCTRCNKLFWRGTHWQRIAAVLKAIEVAGRSVSGER